MNSPHPPHPPFPPPTFNPGHIQNPGPFSPDHGFRQGGPYKHDKPADKRRSPERGYRHDDHRQKGYSHGSHGDKHKMELFGDRKDRGRSPDRRWRPEGGRHRIEYERGRTPPRHRSRERSRWAEGGWGPDSTGGGVGSELYLFSGSGIAIETAGGPSHLTDTGRDPAGWGHSAGAGGGGGNRDGDSPNLRLLSSVDRPAETGSGAAGRRSGSAAPSARLFPAERGGAETRRRSGSEEDSP